MAETIKKTGATPIVENEDLNGGKVHGVTICTTVLVKFRDGRTGRDEVRMAVVVPGGEVYFFPSRGFEQTQQWLKKAILKKMGSVGTTPETSKSATIEITEDNTTQV